MIVCNLIGGLGNQMFQFACGLALALRRQASFKVAIDMFEGYSLHYGYELPRVFDIEPQAATQRDLWHLLGPCWPRAARRILAKARPMQLLSRRFVAEPNFRYWPGLDDCPSEAYLHGYWQSERYFKDREADIRAAFRFRTPISGENAAWAQRITDGVAVSVHVRRGDYVANPRNRVLYEPGSAEYYLAAVDHIRSVHPSAHFYAFSDDPQWVRDNIATRIGQIEVLTHNRGAESYNDMRLMSLCHHHVIANSTFSWWGAWLNPRPEKIVVAPAAWLGGGLKWPEVTPDNWVRL